MINFDRLRKSTEREVTKLERASRREAARVQRAYERKRTKAEQEFLGNAVSELYNSLYRDYQLMQERSNLLSISQEDLEKARKAKKALETMDFETNEKRDAFLQFMEAMDASNSKVKQAMAVLERQVHQEDITSYLSFERGKVYLLAPVAGQDNEELAKNLESKLMDIVSHGSVSLGSPEYNHKAQTAAVPSEVNFSSDYEVRNGFIMYTLSLANPIDTNKLANGLAKKIDTLQPEKFRDAKLGHRTQIINDEIMDYFRNNEINPKIPAEANSRSSEYKLNFSSDNPDEIRAEALQRLDSLGKAELNAEEVREILGVKSHQAVYSISQAKDMAQHVAKIDQKLYFTKEGIEKYIQNRKPGRSGWRTQK